MQDLNHIEAVKDNTTKDVIRNLLIHWYCGCIYFPFFSIS
jgi:hypothetical protein